MPSLLILFLGFSTAVTAVWLKHHLFVLDDDWLVISFPLVLYGLLIGLLSLWLLMRKKAVSFSFPRFAVLGGVILPAIFIFNSQTFLVGWLPGHTPIVPFASWAAANFSFLTKLAAVLALFALLTGILSATGNIILRRFDQTAFSDSYWFFMRLAIGLVVWASFLLILGTLDVLNVTALWLIVLCIALWERQYLLDLLRWCFVRDTWRIDAKNRLFLTLAIGVFLVALNLAETIRPDPVGYDDMTAYMNRAHLMAEGKQLIPGGNPFPFELLAAGIRIGSQDDTMFLALALGVYGLFLGTAVLYALGRAMLSPTVGLLASLIALSLPMGPAIAIAETKPDALLFPITTLFFWSLLRWLEMKDIRHFYFSSFLLGFALSIKLTAIFLLGPLIFSIGFIFFTTHPSFGVLIRQLVLAVCLFLLPLLPWIGYGASTRPDTLPTFSPAQLLLNSPSATTAPFSQEIDSLLRTMTCPMTGAEEDFKRFEKGRSPLAQYLFLPWDLTMNLAVTSFAAEIGPLFLAILSLWILSGYALSRRSDVTLLEQPAIQLGCFALGYFLFWIALAERVPWYGYPGIALLALLTAHTIEHFRSPLLLTRFLLMTLLIGLVGSTLVRMKFSAAPERLHYAAGIITAEEFLDTTFPGLYTLKSALNANPEARIYVTGSRLWYAIENNIARGYMDSHLDTFECLLQSQGPEGMLATLREHKVRYIFFSRSLLQELRSEKNPTFRAKVEHFSNFAGKHLRIVWGSPDYMLFELPQPSKK